MSTLHPLHFSLAGSSRRPHQMERVTLGKEEVATLERVALEIFADMSNAGQPFQKTLSAIYLSGMQHALAARSSPSRRPPR